MLDLEISGANISLSNVVLAATAGAATLGTTNATVATINGEFTTALASGIGKTLAFVENDGATAKTPANLAVNQACSIVCCVNAAGAMKNLQGPIQSLDAAGNLVNPILFPRVPDNLVAFGYLVVKAGSTSSGFIPGTTNWNATGITTTAKSIAVLPSRPVWP